jgi:hypothetical protein
VGICNLVELSCHVYCHKDCGADRHHDRLGWVQVDCRLTNETGRVERHRDSGDACSDANFLSCLLMVRGA